MAGLPWATEEEANAQALDWEQFHERWPGRTWEGWRYKKRMIRQGKVMVQSVMPDVDRPDPVKLLKASIAMQKELDKLYSNCNDAAVFIDTNRPVAIVFLSDAHIGEGGTDIQRLADDVETIAGHEQLYVYLGGDMAHNFILSVMAHFGTMDDQIMPPQAQWTLLRHFVKQLQPSIVAMGVGNHDWWTRRQVGIDKVQEIADEYRLVYTGHGGLLRLQIGQMIYPIYRRHKYRYNSSFNLTHTVKRMLEQGPVDFDIGVVEHGHVPAIEIFQRKGTRRIAIRTGTYLTASAFAAEVGLTWDYGTPVVVLHPDQHRMTPFGTIEEAMAYLG